MAQQKWREQLRRGVVIPAHPLALDQNRKLDERRQRALTRYYLAAGAGGVAVGVHTTQFEIRDPHVDLYRPVLELAIEELRATDAIRVAGIVGPTAQATNEAEFAARCGYHAGLLSLGALRNASVEELAAHARAVASIIPLFGFYLQPAVGGRVLPYEFWRRFVEIENVVAIKMAPFNRYQTLDVVRAVAESGRDIALYTGNDDAIVTDLLTPFRFGGRTVRIGGGLLGHWAVWTRRAVELLDRVHREPEWSGWLTLAAEITDSNAALFDVADDFRGSIAGIHEVLRRQGLLAGRWCLNPAEDLSACQMDEIDRVYAAYPHLNDDDFVRAHLDEWLT
ncbi:MAG TPA: dihydrodipicolinate synthase family protein [Bryobacteraceae bacterium]|nr:dihydrodipicolinate synthase family protein [Bryobacteraceae bacterium]